VAAKNKNESSEEIKWLGLGILSPKGLVLEAYGGETHVSQVIERGNTMPEECSFVVVKAKLTKIKKRQLTDFVKKSRAASAESVNITAKSKFRS
jgi:putative methionine-R-sulfoxide reductase with GAF domain